ncbi:MAG: hypothetical protein E2O82_00305 [Betaproteobacteria bacterium]|nr:MAG: hypothetical protein E2O82_00305 [Betaproteobacteria bacterium]
MVYWPRQGLYKSWDFMRINGGALARIEHWEKEVGAINAGSSQVELGRAKEMLSHARWRA